MAKQVMEQLTNAIRLPTGKDENEDLYSSFNLVIKQLMPNGTALMN